MCFTGVFRSCTVAGDPNGMPNVQVLNRVSLAIAVIAALGVVIILGALLGRGDSPGYSVVIAFVILVSSVPIGMPVVTTTVLAVGAREMAKQKAIVNRQAYFLAALDSLSSSLLLGTETSHPGILGVCQGVCES